MALSGGKVTVKEVKIITMCLRSIDFFAPDNTPDISFRSAPVLATFAANAFRTAPVIYHEISMFELLFEFICLSIFFQKSAHPVHCQQGAVRPVKSTAGVSFCPPIGAV